MFDFCVIGGGMVGATLAIGLSDLGYTVALVESNKPTDFDKRQPPDLRVSAISLTSEKLLTHLGAWRFIQRMRLCQYKRLSVWDEPRARTDFESAAIGASHLGHIVENRIVQLGLHQVIANKPGITCYWNDAVQAIQNNGQSAVTLASGNIIESRILVGADGGNSMVRQVSNIGVMGWQYAQQALGISIKTNTDTQDITWQQFTTDGPLAFLPLYDGFGSLVWYNTAENIRWLKSLSNEKLKQEIVQTFPAELVDFEVLATASFRLTRMHANRYFKGHVVLVGDAAHTINPLAGQGVNLGFKDVTALLQSLDKSTAKFGHQQALNAVNRQQWLTAYQSARRLDNGLMMSAMDSLYGVFSNDFPPFSIIRNLGLKLANRSGPLKKQALKYAMGITQ